MQEQYAGAMRLAPRPVLTGAPAGDSLENVSTFDQADGCLCWVESEQADYRLIKNSIVAAAPPNVIAPTIGPGRWVRTGAPPIPAKPGDDTKIPYAKGGAYQLFTRPGVPLEFFGAVGDGVADDSAALTAALAYFGGIGGGQILLDKTYYVPAGPFAVPADVSIRGTRQGTSTLRTDSNTTVLSVTGQNVELAYFRILGSGAGISQRGIQNGAAAPSSGFSEMRVDHVRCEGLGADGMILQNTLDLTAPVPPKRGPRIDSYEAEGCGTSGLAVGTRAEYVACTNLALRANDVNLLVQGGNFTAVGGFSTEAVTANVDLMTGVNDSHGVITGMLINHATLSAVRAGAITNGFTFVNCEIFYGAVRLTSSRGVKFLGGQIDVDAYFFDGSIGTEFDAVEQPAGLANVVNNDVAGHLSETLWRPTCRLLTGKSSAYAQYVGGRTLVGLSANITYTPAQLGVEQTVLLNVLTANDMTRHPGFSLNTFFNVATGTWTVTGYGDGMFWIRGQLRLVLDPAETGQFYFYIKKNGANQGYLPTFKVTPNILVCHLDCHISAVPTDSFLVTVGSSNALSNSILVTGELFVETQGH